LVPYGQLPNVNGNIEISGARYALRQQASRKKFPMDSFFRKLANKKGIAISAIDSKSDL